MTEKDKDRILECDYGFLKELIKLYFKTEHSESNYQVLNNIKIKRKIMKIITPEYADCDPRD